MITTGMLAALMPAVSAGLQLAAAGVKKVDDANEINQYIDRAGTFNDLFDPDKRETAYAKLYAEMQSLIARKGVTPSAYWWDEKKGEGSPCISIPIATLKEIMDAATR